MVDEFGPWRQVRDHEGTIGWMHVLLLNNKRTALIIKEKLKLFEDTSNVAAVTIIADNGVVAVIDSCKDLWCKLEIDGVDGWVKQQYLWGVYPKENIE